MEGNFKLYFVELKDYCRAASDCRMYAYVCTKQQCECADGFIPSFKNNRTCVGGDYITFTIDN